MEKIFFKSFDGCELHIDMYYPENYKEVAPKSMMVLFFGGGWISGSSLQFCKYAEELARYGMVVALPKYRTLESDGTYVEVAIQDAIYAVEHLSVLGKELGIPAGKMVVGGGSAGGHLALSTVLFDHFIPEHFQAKEEITSLVLFNPGVDLSWAKSKNKALMGSPYLADELSPMVYVKEGMPSTIIFHGESDTTVPIVSVREFEKKMAERGNDCQVIGYEGKNHGFFNFRPTSIPEFYSVLGRVVNYLSEKGYIEVEFLWK